MPLARLPELTKDDLYRLGFVCLDAQSTTRKMVDQLLARSGLDVGRLKIEMELNSFEAIKNAVQIGLGAAFLPVVSIERELAAGSLAPSQCGRPAGAAPAEADHPSRPLLLAGRGCLPQGSAAGVRQPRQPPAPALRRTTRSDTGAQARS
jgi:DNA-binding transcriptional LysR family regulator